MNDQESYLSTKLYSVIQERNLEKVKFLIKSGADVNEKNNSNFAPIHFAILTGDLRFLKIVVEHGADLDAQDLYGNTALHLAVFNNDVEAVEYLISNGASIYGTDFNGPLRHCFAMNLVEMFKLLTKHVNQETKDYFIVEASYSNSIEITEILLNCGANVEARHKYEPMPANLMPVLGANFVLELCSKSCLSWAVEENFVDLGKILISHGANVDHKDFNGQSLLHKAIEKGSCEFVQILVKGGAYMTNGEINKIIESSLANDIRIEKFKMICFMQ